MEAVCGTAGYCGHLGNAVVRHEQHLLALQEHHNTTPMYVMSDQEWTEAVSSTAGPLLCAPGQSMHNGSRGGEQLLSWWQLLRAASAGVFCLT
jgi:hypothetical protein